MSDITFHDEEREGNYPVRTYGCTGCGALHQYKRPFAQVPRSQSPCCALEMCRTYAIDGVRFQTTTPVREVRHKLRKEEREGKRERAIMKDLNPHIATV